MQLQELWSTGLALCTQNYQTEMDKHRAKELVTALELLNAHMQKDFSSVDYAREINSLPKDAKEIKDVPKITTWHDTL